MASSVVLAERTPRRLLRYLPAVLLLAVDQLSKWEALRSLAPQQPVPLLPGFNLTLVFNPGAAFSFLSDASGWQRWFFSALAIVVIVLLSRWIWQESADKRLSLLAYSLILAGAAGNLIDRLVHGHVVDFIDLYYRHWHWPAFNLADSWITLGALTLFLAYWREERT